MILLIISAVTIYHIFMICNLILSSSLKSSLKIDAKNVKCLSISNAYFRFIFKNVFGIILAYVFLL